MKNHLITRTSLASLLLGLVIAAGCTSDFGDSYSAYEPIYILRSDMDRAISYNNERNLQETGKIYIYQDYLLVNEVNEGIHIFNNANPEDPKRIGFISIPGNRDMSIRNGILFADNVTDLLSIQLPIDNVPFKVLHRQQDLFPEVLPPDNLPLSEAVLRARPKDAVIMDYKKRN